MAPKCGPPLKAHQLTGSQAIESCEVYRGRTCEARILASAVRDFACGGLSVQIHARRGEDTSEKDGWSCCCSSHMLTTGEGSVSEFGF